MNENQKCMCPICKQEFSSKEGTTPTEHLVTGLLALYADMQRKASSCDCASNLPCPRCSKATMSDNVHRNALSRRANIHVCDECGTQEAIEAFKKAEMPLTSWFVVSEILCLREPNKTEPPFGECRTCGYEFNSELINEYDIRFCPNCGRKIENLC